MKTGANQANFIGPVAQVAIINFETSISLRELGMANKVIIQAFGLTTGVLALASAGISPGYRGAAGRELVRFVTQMRKEEKILSLQLNRK